jgi:integrase
MNDRTLAGLRPTTRQTYFDTKTAGLALRVGARTKTWYFVYRNGGEPEWVVLGTYPAVGLADARDLALGKRHGLDIDGVDPAAERRKEPEPDPVTAPAFTFADFVPAYVAFQKGRTKDWKNEEAKIRRHLLPAWGALPLKDIRRTHVHELLDTVTGKGLTAGVNRIQALISRMFTVALDRQLVDAHPAARVIKRFTETPRDRVLTDDELRALWAGLDARPGDASDAMRLRLLLGQRGGETAGMLWSELDLAHATWSLPRPRTKNSRPHAVGLPPTALALLERRRKERVGQEPHVFPGFTLTCDAHQALRAITGGAYEWKDLRRTVATRLADLGFDETVIGRVLNHAKYTVTGKHYNQHQYVEEIRQALAAWDTELQRILRNEPKRRSRVLPMRGRS